MDRNDFQKLLEQGGCPSVLLFEGEEEQLKHAAFRRLEKVLLPEGMEQMNESILDNPDTDQLIASVETMPFLSDRRLVVVRDYPPLMGRAEADEKLVAYLPSVPSSSVLLFYCTGKPDGRKKLYAAVRKLNGIVSFSPLRGAELTRFVTDAFKTEGKECDARTAEYLVFTSGDDTGLLLTEIAKIASYAGDRPAVTADDVSALATPSAECTVFQMIDAVVSGQKNKAFLLLRNLLRSGSDRVLKSCSMKNSQRSISVQPLVYRPLRWTRISGRPRPVQAGRFVKLSAFALKPSTASNQAAFSRTALWTR